MPPGRRKQWAQLAASFFLGGLLVYVVQRPAALHADSALLQEGVPKVASAAVPSGTTPATTTAAAASPSSARADRQACAPQLQQLQKHFRAAWICDPEGFVNGNGRRQCYFKAPGGRWLQNGWLEVKEMLPLMVPALRKAVSATTPFVYMDVGCKDAEEAVFVLHTFPEGAQVVALEMRSEWAEVCESKCKEAASASSSVTVLNQAAAVRAGTGSFNPNADSSSIATDGEPGGVHVEFVTLTSVWEQYIAPRKVHLLKTDAEGWDGLILNNGSRALLESRTVQTFIFEYHGKHAGVFWHGELRTFTTEFWRLGYQCFHITATFLFPLTPPELWHPGYEFYAQGNVICSLPGPVLTSLYEGFYGDPGFSNSFEARKTEALHVSPGRLAEPPVATNYTGFVADYGAMLRHDLARCLAY